MNLRYDAYTVFNVLMALPDMGVTQASSSARRPPGPCSLSPGGQSLVSLPGVTSRRGQGQPGQGPGDTEVRQGAPPLLRPGEAQPLGQVPAFEGFLPRTI